MPIDSARWQRIQTLFHEAAEMPHADRAAFLETQCPGDAGLASEVLLLLEEDARGDSLVEQDVAHYAQQILDDPSATPPPFREFGPYRIEKMLGEGGMGMVYLARREDLGSDVAIKVLRDAWLSPARRHRFASEQRTLAQLTHPAIARLYDADTSPDGTPFFVMEFVEGVPITEYCRKRECSLEQRLRLLRSVCDAVLYAHQHAIIHRDLKPSNIFVKDDGTVRLLDFGISKHLENIGGSAGSDTVAALRLMTPAYASPEQIRGEPVGVQSDVYSLGVILYELLTGRLPFDVSDRTPSQAEHIVREQDPEKPSAAAGNGGFAAAITKAAWADLDALCLTAMHKDPRRRYASAEAFMGDIDRFLKGHALNARPDTAGYRLGKFVKRHRRAVSFASAVTLAIIALVAFFTARLKTERDNANRQTAIATAVNQFLSDDLLGRGSPFQSGKAAETLLDAVKQASPSVDRKFADEPQVAARLHLTIAHAFDNRSDFADAREEYERARKLLVQVGGAESLDVIAVQLQRAAMEARTFQAAGVATAKTLIAEQESLLGKLKPSRHDLTVWLYTAKGMLALIESDAKAANRHFQTATDAALTLPGFDEIARLNLHQRLAFTYIRLGDGATAERLARQLIAGYSKAIGPDSPYVLRVRLNLAQAFMIQRKFAESINEANQIYPDFVAKLGPDHELTMQLLTTRAQSEGSIGDYQSSVRDDLTIYEMAVKKQGPISFYSIATLPDAAVAQCRNKDLAGGLANARKARAASIKAFGPRAALTGATSLTEANCLIGLGNFQEAAKLLEDIDTKAVAQLAGDPDWGAGVTLARAEIAVGQGRHDKAREHIEEVRAIFSRPDAEAYQKQKMDELSAKARANRASR